MIVTGGDKRKQNLIDKLKHDQHVRDNQRYYDAVKEYNKKVTKCQLFWDEDRLLMGVSNELRTRFIRAKTEFRKHRYDLKRGIEMHEMMIRAYDALFQDAETRGLNKFTDDFIFVRRKANKYIVCKNPKERNLAHKLYPDMIIFTLEELINGYDEQMLKYKELLKDFNPEIIIDESKHKK